MVRIRTCWFRFSLTILTLGVFSRVQLVKGFLGIDYRQSNVRNDHQQQQFLLLVRSWASSSRIAAAASSSIALEEPDLFLDMSPPKEQAKVAFSHVHLYADHLEDLHVYKNLENDLNRFAAASIQEEQSSKVGVTDTMSLVEQGRLWQSLTSSPDSPVKFVSHGRDVVKQLIAGLGFRVTASLYSEQTRTVLITSKDPDGVQILVTTLTQQSNEPTTKEEQEKNEIPYYFRTENVQAFYKAHANRPGIAVLGFLTESMELIHDRYQRLHPGLISHSDDTPTYRILEVFAYYQRDSKTADPGTILRFVQQSSSSSNDINLPLPGLVHVPATFDESSTAAYCDHWVSNVWSRTEFLDTLADTLGFVPKVDFNAGVVAAGEAQIESTVTGNDSLLTTDNPRVALKDQSQVYLPINNALSSVGHVHGFLNELGQGIQHLASRVENLVDFVQTANDRRQIFGEGFTFLRIPRSYYGILTPNLLTSDANDASSSSSSSLVSFECANAIVAALRSKGVVLSDGAVDLQVNMAEVHSTLEQHLEPSHLQEYLDHKDEVLAVIGRSRYRNLYALLRDHLSEETYLGIVRNQILVDIQGDDLLYQIFTSNILQRQPGDEAPFFEFIQRVCSECKNEKGCPQKIRPGCGGFGIRNFLTLFLSIEVSKAMQEVSDAREAGDVERETYAQTMVDYFTSQLSESNPILTEISDAMTLEGYCKEQMMMCVKDDPAEAQQWKLKMEDAACRKQRGNEQLMECSARYNTLMKSLREKRNEDLASS